MLKFRDLIMEQLLVVHWKKLAMQILTIIKLRLHDDFFQ
jgi:hypothetical protein